MKKTVLLLMAMLIALPVSLQAWNDNEGKNELKVMSYNIRLGSGKDGNTSWNMRYAATAEMLKDQLPDVFGVQEALSYQIYFIEDNFRDYKCVGVGREDGK